MRAEISFSQFWRLKFKVGLPALLGSRESLHLIYRHPLLLVSSYGGKSEKALYKCINLIHEGPSVVT